MSRLLIIAILTIFTIAGAAAIPLIPQARHDTLSINEMNQEAMIIARRNPDMSLILAHRALFESTQISYGKGVADATLALGMAHLAKYNSGDSAYIYSNRALELYQSLDNSLGKARACYALSYVYSFKGDLDESERYCSLSLNFFEKAGDKRGMVNAYNALSYLAKQQPDLIKARGLIQQSIEAARSIEDTLLLADAINSLGNIYKDMALFKIAIESYFEALRLWTAKGDSSGLSIAYGSIGLMYYYQQDYDQALEFSFKKLPISEKVGDVWEVSKTLNTISLIYNSMAEHDNALYYLRKGLRLNYEMNYTPGIADVFHNMANTMLLKSEVDSAFIYISKAVDLARSNDTPELETYLITLGRIYLRMGDYNMALSNARNAYQIAKDKGLPIVIAEAAALLSDIYSRNNRNDLAYPYLREYYLLKDSINNDEFHKEITRLEFQYDFDRRQKVVEYEQLQQRLLAENKIKQQGLYLKGLAILILLGSVISLLIIRQNKMRSKYARMDLEQRLLRAQMNPHFIFNSLCAVQDFILAGEPQKANIFLTKIARLMRNILENTREEYIPLSKEIETLKLYLDVQQLRFEQEFEYRFIIDELLDTENISVPPMLAQPCIENSIEHGLLPLSRQGHLSISYTLKNGLLLLDVSDDGIGRDRASGSATGKMKKESISTRLTEKRLEHFRKALKEKGISYEIIDLYDGDEASGTRVLMMLPYKKVYA